MSYGKSKLSEETRRQVIKIIKRYTAPGYRIYSEYQRIKVLFLTDEEVVRKIDSEIRKTVILDDMYLHYVTRVPKEDRPHNGLHSTTFYFRSLR